MSELKPRITENGIDYILVGDYYIPDLKLPEVHRPIGKYGRMHREYLREVHPARLNTLILTCFLASNFPHFHRYDSLKSALYIHAVSKNINTFPKNQGRIRAAIAVKILDFTVMYR